MINRDAAIGAAAGLTVTFIWSGWLVLNRLAASQDLTAWDIIALRFTIASLALLPVFILRNPFKRLGWRKSFALAILGPAIPYSALTIYGLEFAPAAHAGVVSNGLMPAMTAALTFLAVRQAPNRMRWIGLILITVGVAAVGWSDIGRADLVGAWRGHILFAIAALLLAGYITLCAQWGVRALDAAVTVAFFNVVAILPLWLLGVFPSGFATAPMGDILLQGLYQGLGPGVIGIILMTVSITRLGAPTAGALTALVPGVTAVAALILLGEPITVFEGLGVALTVSGIMLSALAGTGKRSPPTG